VPQFRGSVKRNTCFALLPIRAEWGVLSGNGVLAATGEGKERPVFLPANIDVALGMVMK